MRFLVDAQLPPGLCRWLQARGHEADHVTELGLGAAPDSAVAERAAADGAILVTKDEDFTHLRLLNRFALLWLRCGNTTNHALGEWLEARWDRAEDLLAAGEGMLELR